MCVLTGIPGRLGVTDAAVSCTTGPEWANAGLASSGLGTNSPSLFTNYSSSTGAVPPAQGAPLYREITDAAVSCTTGPEWANAGLASSGLGTGSPTNKNDCGPNSCSVASAPTLTLLGDGQGGVGHHAVLFESTL